MSQENVETIHRAYDASTDATWARFWRRPTLPWPCSGLPRMDRRSETQPDALPSSGTSFAPG